jgi:hypothetical protein
VILLEVGSEIDPGSRRAEGADIGRRERAHHVGDVAASDRGGDLVVDDVADDLYLDLRMLRVVLRDEALELLELVGGGAPADPRGDRDGLRSRGTCRSRRVVRFVGTAATEAPGQREGRGEQNARRGEAFHVQASYE